MTDAAYYLAHIASYEREFKKWESRVDKIIKRYRDEERRGATGQARFNVLWSNVQTLKSATFARMPMPNVSRRFKDNDPVGRVAALILERALEFEVQHYIEFGASLRQCVYDRFLGGRGVAWERYDPTFEVDGDQITEDEEAPERLVSERTATDYVHWRDFGHAVSRTWEECPIVWRKVYMTREKLEERFGDAAAGIPLDAVPQDPMKVRGGAEDDSAQKRACLYEIWDKDRGCCLHLSKSTTKIIEEVPDPLKLENFFPCPPPVYSTLTTDSLVPIPDFTLYQDQATELDTLADRIDGLIKALKVMGVYDASQPDLKRLFTEGENGVLIPVNQWAQFAEKKGLAGAIDIVDLAPIAEALREAYGAFQQVKGQIYELTGISDILRGETSPSETATAQQIKNSYASLRLKTYQDEVERFAARLLQLKAQIICGHFSDETILQMAAADQLADADKQYVGPALQMLRSNVMRAFRIEVATDSMVYQDEQQEKQDRMEFLEAVSGFMEKAVEAGKAAPQLVPLAIELLKFGVSGFRVGKSLEGTIDQAADALRQQAANPGPTPESIQADAEKQKVMIQAQADNDKAQMQLRHDAALEQMRQQHEQAMKAIELRADAEADQRKLDYQMQCEQLKANQEAQLAAKEEEFERWKTQLENDTKALVAQIAADKDLQKAAISASDATTEVQTDGSRKPSTALQSVIDAMNQNLAAILQGQQSGQQQLLEVLSRPKQLMRGPDGRVVGVQ